MTVIKMVIFSAEAVRRKSLVLKFQKPETPIPTSKRKRKYQVSQLNKFLTHDNLVKFCYLLYKNGILFIN